MNVWMMRNGRAMATDGSAMNDKMTAAAISFMESQVSDPVLREKLRPYSKCELRRLVRTEENCC